MMKTKFLLAAIALPLAFTACTSEDVIEQAGGQTNIENRALLGDVTFVEGVDSRLAYDGEWAWEDGDKFSAHLIDAATAWSASDVLATNYIYSKDGEKYSTTSRMVEGLYWFYAPAKEDKLDRKMMSFELPIEQTMDVENPNATIEAQEVFFSPVYKMEAKNDAANVNVPLTVRSYFSTALIPVKNTGTTALRIKKIHVETTTALAYKGDISPAKIAAKWQMIYKDGAWTNKKNDDGTALSTNPMAEDYVAANDNKKTSNVFMLTVDKVVEPGETFTANMLMPAGNAGVCTVTIVLDNGKGFVLSTPGLQFNHHAKKAVFGLTNGQANAKSINGAHAGSVSAVGHYVLNNDEVINYLMSSTGEAAFTQVGEWSLNADAITAISNYTSNVEFTKGSVEMESATTAIELKNLVNTAITLKSGALKVNDFAKDITVKGGELTLIGDAYGNITNDGAKVTVNAASTVSTGIYNYGELVFAESSTVGTGKIATLVNGKYTSDSEYTAAKITVNAGKTLTLGTATLCKKSEIVANGDIVMTSGQVDNYGKITVATGVKVTSNGLFHNHGTMVVSGEVNDVINHGDIKAESNMARITFAYDANGTGANPEGTIDNTNLAYVAGKVYETGATAAAQTIYYTVSTAINNEGFKTLDAAIKGYGINTLKFASSVTLNGELQADLTGVKTLVFGTGSSLVLGNGTKQSMDVTEIVVEDNVTFQGYSVANSAIGFQNNAKITVAKGKKLTVNYMTIASAQNNTLDIVLKNGTASGFTTWGYVDNTNGRLLLGTGKVYANNNVAANVIATPVLTATTTETINWKGTAPTDGYYTATVDPIVVTITEGTDKW